MHLRSKSCFAGLKLDFALEGHPRQSRRESRSFTRRSPWRPARNEPCEGMTARPLKSYLEERLRNECERACVVGIGKLHQGN
jgi:hypothetical protein